MNQPQPVGASTVCSECGLAWNLHGATPTLADCVALLRAELARRVFTAYPTTYVYPYPYTITTTPTWLSSP
jgi:hypothetical protein